MNCARDEPALDHAGSPSAGCRRAADCAVGLLDSARRPDPTRAAAGAAQAAGAQRCAQRPRPRSAARAARRAARRRAARTAGPARRPAAPPRRPGAARRPARSRRRPPSAVNAADGAMPPEAAHMRRRRAPAGRARRTFPAPLEPHPLAQRRPEPRQRGPPAAGTTSSPASRGRRRSLRSARRNSRSAARSSSAANAISTGPLAGRIPGPEPLEVDPGRGELVLARERSSRSASASCPSRGARVEAPEEQLG